MQITNLGYYSKKETTEHLLLSCPEYSLTKTKTKDKLNNIRLTLPILLHLTFGIKATLDLLQETRLATRKWHLVKSDKKVN